MTGRGRPPIGPPVTVRLPADLRVKLEKRAKGEKVPVAEMVRRLLRDALS